MKLRKYLVAALPAVVLLMTITAAAPVKACDYGPGSGCGFGGCGYQGSGCGFGCGEGIGCGGCGGGYYAGIQEAQYDIQNSLQYQPYGSCLPRGSSCSLK